jgi:menaquinone-dependent protoporphyrinogen oxidase
MTTSILVAYATRYGSTKEVADAVAATLRDNGHDVEVRPARDVQSLERYDAVVLGAAFYMHRWHRAARRFLARHRKSLEGRRVAIFALGPTDEPGDEEAWEESRAQLDEVLAKFSWLDPVDAVMFGGKFDPATLPFPINKLAGSEPASDIRDWDAIRAWAEEMGQELLRAPQAEAA